MGRSWNIPGFDVYDPSLVLYAPLWRPDMVARGGSIKNGTGTMDVNPQALAVGANTITVTTAGTLIVAMPEGGTVASGTMTVTGSPVTIPAGGETTITTTGAIGNITVTPSNIIRSKDRNNHAMTVTGATWGYQGRTFASGNVITTATSAVFEVATAATLACWVNVDASVPLQNQLGISLDNRPTQSQRLELWVRRNAAGNRIAIFDTVSGAVREATASADVGSFSFIAVTMVAGGNYIFYKNDATLNSAAYSATMPAWTAGTIVADIGNNANSLPFVGIGGAYWAYNRDFSAQEIQQLRLSTKWRFV